MITKLVLASPVLGARLFQEAKSILVFSQRRALEELDIIGLSDFYVMIEATFLRRPRIN